MKKQNIIGYDLNDAACQISFYDEQQHEPVTLEVAVDNYQIPLIIAKQNDNWIIGKEAKKLSVTNQGVAAYNLLSKSLKNEKIDIDNETYDAVWLLCKFIYLTLQDFERIEIIVFSVPNVNEDISKTLKGITHLIGVENKHIYVQDYKESFCNYMLYQPKELWQYEAALFYCDSNEVRAYMLRELKMTGSNNHGTFVTVDAVAKADMKELAFVYPILHVETAKEADERFKLFIENVFAKKVVSSVFLTGDGFENNWYPNSLRVLCNGRRTFLGNNLYSKGACYTAYRRMLGRTEGPIYLDETRLMEQICLKMRIRGKNEWFPIVSWGEHWYESDRQWEVILEDTQDIELHIESLTKGELRAEKIGLEGLPNRGSYSIRLQIKVLFLNKNTCKIIVKDIGFGEMFLPTEFLYETTIQLGGSNGQFNPMS